MGRHEEAIAEFEALLAHHPKDVPALLQLGLADKARGRLDAASEWLARACAEDPANAVARFHHGEVLYNRGLSEPALASLKDAIAQNPDYAEAHYLLAFVYGDLGQHEAARAATKRAVALNPMLARAQANLALDRGAGQRGSGATGQAGAERDAATQPGAKLARCPAAPPPRSPWLARRSRTTTSGWRCGRRGIYDDALREYQAGLDAGEDRRLNLQAMAEVHLLRRDLTAALELYDALVAGVPRLSQAVERAWGVSPPGRDSGPRRSPRTRRRLEPTRPTSWRGTTSA